ncbi:LTA synthase family protein [Microbulbifer magnicolonia]|uniref:LTA synthase family protein n=1 Tax=Microbulbifer magnicolonia TaxID=3109744 RepID=UPI002B408335|nr:sulfatase-like hydrolase/transferase [Microbulbifer sp. GG15]
MSNSQTVKSPGDGLTRYASESLVQPFKILPAKMGAAFAHTIDSRAVWICWAWAVLAYALIARGWFYAHMFTVEAAPFGFDAHQHRWLDLMLNSYRDLRFVLPSTLVLAVAGAALVWLMRRRGWKSGWWRHLPVLAMLLFVGVFHGAFYRVALVMHVPLGFDALQEAWLSGFGFAEFKAELTPTYTVLMVLPAVLYLFALFLNRGSWRRIRNGMTLCLVAALAVLPGFDASFGEEDFLRVNPVIHVSKDVIKGALFSHNRFADQERAPSAAQMESVRWVDPAFVGNAVPPSLRRAESALQPGGATAGGGITAADDFDVVLLILESVGRRYIFDTNLRGAGQPNPKPMPFLHKLSREGVFFGNHYSPSNSSPRSIFSLVTGLGPVPVPYLFATRSDIQVPTLGDFIDRRSSFLVTPSRTAHYFPRALFLHAGIEIQDYYSIPQRHLKRPGSDWLRDERDTMDAFIERVTTATGPFFGIYYSGAAHMDYTDYGPEYRVIDSTDREIDRYYNNLRLLDVQLERFYAALQASGRADRTILVIAGDHGEAFGQHKGNWGHARASYEENFATFALIHQPRLFAPARIERPTVHSDVLPTLLDGMDVDFDRDLIQGESAFAEGYRKYIFLYGNENTVSSIDRDGTKLQLIYQTGECRVYDLANDPLEAAPLACEGHEEQKIATLKYKVYQSRILSQYNAGLRTAKRSDQPLDLAEQRARTGDD